MLYLLLCLLLLSYVDGGSKCPKRSDIYPCICIDRSIGKSRFDTTLICHGLENGASLMTMESDLSQLEINKFMLYDSFWSTGLRSQAGDSRIPVNVLSSFKIEEIEVVDSALSNFACPANYNCRTNYLKRFSITNSSMSDKSTCSNSGLNINLWISCPANIEVLVINKGFTSDTTLKPEFFPEPLSKLKALHMPYNQISRIDRKTFSQTKFPVLQTLDLSYNALRDAKNIFSSSLKLKTLDLSFNSLRTLVDFQYLPQLQSLKLSDNQIVSILENEWQIVPPNLRHIDLSNNNLVCNCGTKFVNSTIPIHTTFLGTCGTQSSAEVINMKVRRASRLLIQRCNAEGQVGPPPKKH